MPPSQPPLSPASSRAFISAASKPSTNRKPALGSGQKPFGPAMPMSEWDREERLLGIALTEPCGSCQWHPANWLP